MMRMFMLLLSGLLSIFFLSTIALADDAHLRDQILASLAKQPEKHFHFVQEKKLAMLDKPLITEGELLLAQNTSNNSTTVTWDIQKPYTLRYILTADTIREIDAQGERTLQIGQNPIAAAMTQAMTATFSGQWQDNNALAHIVATGKFSAWQLLITPQAVELQPLIKTLSVTGREGVIASIVIAESNGDSTSIHLQALTSQ
jgi:hypothetical protein